ncbi:MAG: hydrogen peroxide-inducible genes activator [Alphaproteobacteria bacterium]|nr:hydrogen peroxide-inducible genes activator [Alphaproteobacteria bacterium]MBU1548676.1 hydrogen peroxide-inducible genes activator [Alphaproteobacteria bacterium]MBU2335502.1 hydrogen peroxide-inducible genes activator [Alphaproteobacteria bacterium]MBU2391103.1 hydrogen peroxide-inducible genes activator [Alphaproteobacteria bacterium]
MPYRPTVRQLEYLVMLGETGHFGEAAKRCHVSQPTLSVQIALLEQRLGCALIDRTPGLVAPTPAGLEVIASARTVLDTLDGMVAVASASQGALGGLIRLGAVPTFGPYFLPRLLPQLHAAYPGLRLHIREERPLLLEEQVADGSIHCGLGPAPAAGDTCEFSAICEERIFLGVSRRHRLAGRETVDLASLAGEQLLTLGRGHRLLDTVRDLARVSGAHLVDDYEGTSLDALRQMVSIDMGLSLFPELYVRSEFRSDQDVHLLRIEGWPGVRTIGFFWRRHSVRDAHYRRLAELGKAAARDLLG